MVKPRWLVPSFLMVCCSLQVACGRSSEGKTSWVKDPTNDLLNPGAAYRDIQRAEINKNGGEVIFRAELAGEMPSSPSLPPSVLAMVWEWNIQSDDRFPTGFPNVSSMQHWPELQAQLVWDGTKFEAFLIDRRPSLTGSEVVVKSIPFSIRGPQLDLNAGGAGIDIPGAFGWVMVTNDWLVPRGQVSSNDQVLAIDIVPDQPPPTGPLPVPANLVKF